MVKLNFHHFILFAGMSFALTAHSDIPACADVLDAQFARVRPHLSSTIEGIMKSKVHEVVEISHDHLLWRGTYTLENGSYCFVQTQMAVGSKKYPVNTVYIDHADCQDPQNKALLLPRVQLDKGAITVPADCYPAPK